MPPGNPGPGYDTDDPVQTQLRADLELCGRPLLTLLDADDLAGMLTARIAAFVPALTRQLRQYDGERVAAQTVIDLLGVLWPTGGPDPAWWRTPLGRLCAHSYAHHADRALTHSQAAAYLGVTRGTIAQLAFRGTLDRHPDGGVTEASVLLRIAQQAEVT